MADTNRVVDSREREVAGSFGRGRYGVNEPADPSRAHLRVARSADDLAAVVAFYRDGIGFDVLFEFADHDGFDGARPTADHLLVPPARVPDEGGRKAAVGRLERAGYQPVAAFNPYWDKDGKTFEDPDGYRVVLRHAVWPAEHSAAFSPLVT